ncbi:hypothetical protein ESCO_004472 [Escovopsis weberi]|uniref:GXWXG domain-containing protein n=1 Tax=Escovopsis weberi TaxID=150374 RepID=A0A0M8N6X2_ESCWE|nr:hypothetical protein ESCO_004472 [Escovopsis weberi]
MGPSLDPKPALDALSAASILHSGSPVSQPQIESLFDTLRPVDPPFLLGAWAPGYVNVQSDAAQRTNDLLRGMRWAGKDFHSEDDVDALMLWGDAGREAGGHKARLREIKSRGTVTTAMIYDDAPIIDTFKRVTDDLVLGMMDHKDEQYPRNYMFYLERLK